MTDSTTPQPDGPYDFDLAGLPSLREGLLAWARQEADRRAEPTLKHMFKPTLKCFDALLGCNDEPDNPHDRQTNTHP
ncbi:hypothetical protein [Nocardia amamiensis]|uniref:hypothetical protein n=1 Tax=Nocardia amamiensis TaxID=404578 RepID=UPI000830E4B2|nr:hypothetical protein [Nocardia amamiensis]